MYKWMRSIYWALINGRNSFVGQFNWPQIRCALNYDTQYVRLHAPAVFSNIIITLEPTCTTEHRKVLRSLSCSRTFYNQIGIICGHVYQRATVKGFHQAAEFVAAYGCTHFDFQGLEVLLWRWVHQRHSRSTNTQPAELKFASCSISPVN